MKHYYQAIKDLPVKLLTESYDYIKASDAAHNEEHIRAVVLGADSLCDMEGIVDRLQIITAALLHDVGCSIKGGRDGHHIYSTHIAKGLLSDYPELCTDSMIKAIIEHRASFTGVRSGITSNIVAAADRGRPNAPVLILRAYLYTKEINDVDHDTAVRHALDYNVSKYGSNGYARMRDNSLLMKYYSKEAIDIESIFDNATVDYVEECLDKLTQTN